MYEVIQSVIGTDISAHEDIVISITGAVCCLLVVVFVDFIKEIFFGFFRG